MSLSLNTFQSFVPLPTDDTQGNMLTLQNKRVLLLGSTGVLGSEFAQHLVENGVLLVAADLDSPKLIELGKSLKCKTIPIDCASEASVADGVSESLNHLEYFDAAIFNSAITSEYLSNGGIPVNSDFEDHSLDLWNKTLQVNLTGAFLFARETYKGLRVQSKSSLVLTSSIYGMVSPDHRIYEGENFGTFPGYSASKAGLMGLMRWLSTLWAPQGIRVNCLVPGGVYNNQSDSFEKKYSNRNPMGRMAMAEEINGALHYLVSDSSSYTTGQNIIVDGGLTSW